MENIMVDTEEKRSPDVKYHGKQPMYVNTNGILVKWECQDVLLQNKEKPKIRALWEWYYRLHTKKTGDVY